MKLLYHFIGRGKPEDEAYGLLLRILNCGCLIPNQKGENAYFDFGPLFEKIHLGDRLPVSFIDRDNCDDSAFKEHMEKYSKFGIGFEKDFILREGGEPAFYCINRNDGKTSCENRMHICNLVKSLDNIDVKDSDIKKEFYEVLKFVKPFNIDTNNQKSSEYFEREWRIIATDGIDGCFAWNFTEAPAIYGAKDTIREIIVPRAYQDLLRNNIANTVYYKKYSSRSSLPKLCIAEEIDKGHVAESIGIRIE